MEDASTYQFHLGYMEGKNNERGVVGVMNFTNTKAKEHGSRSDLRLILYFLCYCSAVGAGEAFGKVGLSY